LAAKACQRRSSYTVPGFRAVISQAAVTRLASLKRGPINADSLGENLVFRKSADVKKVSNGSFQKKNVRYFATTRVSWLLWGVRWRKSCPEFV
jgi:hypothetical protein